jgi:hypothetical protein
VASTNQASSDPDSPDDPPDDSSTAGDTQDGKDPAGVTDGVGDTPEGQTAGTPDGTDGAADGDGDTTGVTAPEEKETVTLNVITDPKGADVFVGDEKEPRGETPLEITFDKSDQEVRIAIKRRRFKDEVRTFVPETNQEFDLKLARVPRKRSGKTGGKTTKTYKPDKDVMLEEPDW